MCVADWSVKKERGLCVCGRLVSEKGDRFVCVCGRLVSEKGERFVCVWQTGQ